MLGHLQGNLHAVVVYIRNEGHRLVCVFKALADFLYRLGMGQGRHREAHDFTADFMQPPDTGRSPFDIEGVLVDHRLHRHRVIAADPDISHPHAAGLAPVNQGVVASRGAGHGWVKRGAGKGKACHKDSSSGGGLTRKGSAYLPEVRCRERAG